MGDTHDNLTQAEAAALMQVDRTTIRAWTEAGMPYVEPPARGKEASYSAFMLLHWRLWQGFRKQHPGLELEPLQAIAVMRAFHALDDHAQGREDYYRNAPKAFAPYLSPTETRHLLDFALGYASALLARAA